MTSRSSKHEGSDKVAILAINFSPLRYQIFYTWKMSVFRWITYTQILSLNDLTLKKGRDEKVFNDLRKEETYIF